MPHEILKTMRALREDMRHRLLQLPEYRALVALDRSIEEICGIMREALEPAEASAPPTEPAPAPAPEAAPASPVAVRQSAIASAFAETLAAKIDHRQARAANGYAQGRHALGG
jgi:hypothetical protein